MARTDYTGNSWFSSLIAAVAVVAVAVVVAAAVVASAGAVACAVGVTASIAGASSGTVAVASAAATAGCYAVAAGVVATGVSDAGEVLTGTNVIRDYVLGGDQGAYDALEVGLTIASAGIMELGYMAREAGVCFIAGTLVLTEDGPKALESIHTGDYVWAWDESAGDVALKQVIETYINETNELTHIIVNGEEIVCTPSHPFYAPQKGWTEACRLRAGDILVLVNGEYVVVEKVQHELLESPVKVYNFQVQDYHTYYVANIGVLVHNSCSGGRHGGEQHRTTVNETKQQLSDLGFEVQARESRVNIPGTNHYRYPDITATKGDTTLYVQVGRITRSGNMVAREARAFADLLSTGKQVMFVPYNR